MKDYVAGWRQRAEEMFVPLGAFAGDVEADLLAEAIIIGGVERRFHSLLLTCRTRMPASWSAIRQTTEAFCDGHVRAFAFFGGVPKSILYDNTKIVAALHPR